MATCTAALYERPAALPARVADAMLQRTCSCGGHTLGGGECAECRRAREAGLQRSARTDAAPAIAPPIVDEVLRTPGTSLDGETRALFETRLRHDFSGVRVHADRRAADSARAVHAAAYTVGSHVVFAEGRYAPGTAAGRALLAHELAHVVQQAGASQRSGLRVGPADSPLERDARAVGTALERGVPVVSRRGGDTSVLQRDLATEPPAVAAPAQPDLTDAQVAEAIAFNRARYNTANTRLIQDLLGGPVTGTWTAENIRAIAVTQEEYGLQKDGKVGHETFVFLNREQRREGMSTSTRNCLVAFRVIGPDAATFGRNSPTECRFGGHFRTEAEFSSRCGCPHFQYRQFIRGHVIRTRGAVVTDIGNVLGRIPGGQIPAAFVEDGDTADPIVNYGHRNDAAEANPVNRYINAAGVADQAGGCRYESEDFPGHTALPDCLPGDSYDIDVSFRGEIQRDGTPIQSKQWTAIRRAGWTP